ncbi:SPOR domain-containing protein [Chitinimonas naiadis]
MKRLLLSLLAVTSVFMAGCASIMNGSTHELTVISEPPGASVLIKSRNGSFKQTVTTPTTLALPRGAGYMQRNDYVLEFNKEGYETQKEELDAHGSRWYGVGNVFSFGPLGWFWLDAKTGSMFVYDKKVVDAKLVPLPGTSAPTVSYVPTLPVATAKPTPVAVEPTAPAAKPRAPIPAATPVYVAPVASPAEAPAKVDTSNLKLGTWSYDVEQMAKAAGCQGEGAWLISKPGMKEAYRVFCKDGKPFTAVCDSTSCTRG